MSAAEQSGNSSTATMSTAKQVDVAREAAARSMAAMFDSQQYTDLILKIDDTHFHAHRVVVCSRSDVFQVECEEATNVDGRVTLRVNAPSATKATVGRVLAYLYKNDYSDEDVAMTEDEGTDDEDDDFESINADMAKERQSPSIHSAQACPIDAEDVANTFVPAGGSTVITLQDRALNNARVFVMAWFYDIADLKAVAVAKFENAVNAFLENLAFEREAEAEITRKVARLVTEMWQVTTRNGDLRDVFTACLASHWSLLGQPEQLLTLTSHLPFFMSRLLSKTVKFYKSCHEQPLPSRASQDTKPTLYTEHTEQYFQLRAQLEDNANELMFVKRANVALQNTMEETTMQYLSLQKASLDEKTIKANISRELTRTRQAKEEAEKKLAKKANEINKVKQAYANDLVTSLARKDKEIRALKQSKVAAEKAQSHADLACNAAEQKLRGMTPASRTVSADGIACRVCGKSNFKIERSGEKKKCSVRCTACGANDKC